MIRPIYQKFLFYASVGGVVVSILAGFYDVVFGSLFEAAHLAMEVVEMGLDNAIEERFHTEKHETEYIVFYALLGLGGLLIYLVWKLLAVSWASFNKNLGREWVELKDALTDDWEAMPTSTKFIWLAMFLLVNYLISFLLF